MIVGAPKNLEEFQTFSAVELVSLFQGVEELATSGRPLAVPQGIPLGQLARMAVTLRRFHKLLFQMAEVAELARLTDAQLKAAAEAGGTEVGESGAEALRAALPARAMQLAEEAHALVHAPPPTEKRIVEADSNIVLP